MTGSEQDVNGCVPIEREQSHAPNPSGEAIDDRDDGIAVLDG